MSRTRDPLRGRTPQLEVSWGQVCGWRLARQHVTEPATDPVAVTAALGGVQAQVTSSARFTLRVRSTTAAAQVDEALWVERRLVKTWAMRGTLHWLPADEYALWIAALRTREWRITPGWERYHGVTRAELEAITEAIPAALEGRQLTRDELAERLAELTGRTHLAEQLRSGWGAVLKPAANRGLLCFAADRGRNVVFTRPQDWLGDPGPQPDPDSALRTVLQRFLDAYGPATAADFARWFGITGKPARELFAAHADDLAVIAIDGTPAWVTPAGARDLASARPATGVALLGAFDPYVLAPISHRAAIIPDGRLEQVSRTAGWISPVILVDGLVAGTWDSERSGDVTTVVVRPFADLPATARDDLAQRAESLLPGPVALRITEDA